MVVRAAQRAPSRPPRRSQGVVQPAPVLPAELHLQPNVGILKAVTPELCLEYHQLNSKPVIGLLSGFARPRRVRRLVGVEVGLDASHCVSVFPVVRVRRGGREALRRLRRLRWWVRKRTAVVARRRGGIMVQRVGASGAGGSARRTKEKPCAAVTDSVAASVAACGCCCGLAEAKAAAGLSERPGQGGGAAGRAASPELPEGKTQQAA